MHKDHTQFPIKHKKTTKIWRYLSFTKFVSLLATKSLFFSRADKLNDKFEGSFSDFNVKLRPTLYKNAPDLLQQIPTIHKNLIKKTYLIVGI